MAGTLQFKDIAIENTDPLEMIDLDRLFPGGCPVEIEIGSGKGTFLLNQARSQPDTGFLGVEWANKYYQYSMDRIRRWDVRNVRLIRADASVLIRHQLPPGRVSAFHVYFPDPWPKKRHHKRRFLQAHSMLQMYRCLAPGGQIRIATDHAGYFEWIQDHLEQTDAKGQLFDRIDFFPLAAAGAGEWVGSNFERKYRIEGRTFHNLALRKRIEPLSPDLEKEIELLFKDHGVNDEGLQSSAGYGRI